MCVREKVLGCESKRVRGIKVVYLKIWIERERIKDGRLKNHGMSYFTPDIVK